MVAPLVIVAALWGAAVGLLLPHAAYRFSVPEEEDWLGTCPEGHPLAGWIGRNRCERCAETAVATRKATRKATRTKTESYGPGAAGLCLATALVCAALAAATGTRPELGVWLLLAPVGVLLAVVDLRVQRLPDALTLLFAGAALALLGAVALVPEHAGDWPTALYAALALGAAFFGLFLLNPGGMGFGDVKLAVGLGAVLGWYGWGTVMVGTFAAFLLGALYGGLLVLLRRAGRKTAIAFGPFLIGGAFLGLLVGAYAA
ncbi:A24 family peptidase [Streptomyces sp. NPDC005648]|uniref:A24 family peptidase n=1 Tax=Streptomyces sp. NPDC005648 TaxID=3157044 RepID=UPI0033AC5713